MKNDLAIIAIAVCFASSAFAASDGPEPRTVTVTGEAEVKVAPDEVILVLGAESINKELGEVKKAHDQRVRNVLGAVHAAGIAPKNVQSLRAQIRMKLASCRSSDDRPHESQISPDSNRGTHPTLILLECRDLTSNT